MKKQLLKMISLLCVLALALGCVPLSASAEDTGEVRVILVEWKDENDYDGLRPERVTMSLGESTLELSAANNWTGELVGSAGAEWTVQTVNGYAVSVEEGDITVVTYRHGVQKTAFSAKAVWNDGDNEKNVRPKAVQIRLLADGVIRGSAVTLHEGNGWSAAWEELPRNRQGSTDEVKYTVETAGIPEYYTAEISGNTVTYALKTGSLRVQGSVAGAPEDADLSGLTVKVTGPDSTMPVTIPYSSFSEGVTLSNLLEGVYLVTETNADVLVPDMILDASASVTQDAVQVKSGETASVTLKNTYTDEIPDPSLNPDPTADYDKLTFEILGPDPRMPVTVTYAEFTDGKYELDNLVPGSYAVIERNAGTLVQYYTLLADSVTGMSITVGAGGTAKAELFNHYGPAETPEPDAEFVDIPVIKVWDDNGDEDGNRPDSITVRLFADGVEVDSHVLTEAEGWKYTFTGLPKYQEDHVTEIVYSVNEDAVEWYIPVISGFTIVNRYEPELTSVSVQKIWRDNGDEAKLRPKAIAVSLSNGFEIVTTVELNAENGWTATIENLPTKKDGKKLTYAWKEHEVFGYKLTSVAQEGSVMIFTNELFQRPEAPEGEKPPKTPGETWYVFEEYETPLGVEVIINHVGDCFD